MKYRRKQQLTIILVLVVAIASLSVGFAAFSAALNISSSASITPNSDNFSVVFSSSQYAITTNNTSGTVVNGIGTNGAMGGITSLYQNSASGLIAEFTEPGQSLDITIYAHNTGEYDAYLRGVNITNIDGSSYKKCTAATNTTDALVQSACNGISISVNVAGTNHEYGKSISNHVLSKGSVEPIIITVAYNSDAARADGNFDISFGDISLEYSTIDNRIITFKADGTTCQTVAGTTWLEYINSSDNTSGIYYNSVGGSVYSKLNSVLRYKDANGNVIFPTTNDTILEGVSYYIGGDWSTTPT